MARPSKYPPTDPYFDDGLTDSAINSATGIPMDTLCKRRREWEKKRLEREEFGVTVMAPQPTFFDAEDDGQSPTNMVMGLFSQYDELNKFEIEVSKARYENDLKAERIRGKILDRLEADHIEYHYDSMKKSRLDFVMGILKS